MPVPAGAVGGQQSCSSKIYLGFCMGAVIGGATGLVLGGFSGFRLGIRGASLLKYVGKTAAQSGGSFGVFMAVAQGIRC